MACLLFKVSLMLLIWFASEELIHFRFSAIRNGVNDRTKFFKKDLWKFDTSPYNCIVIFGVEQMMEDLEKKLGQELKPDAKVVACRFPFPNHHLRLVKQIDEGIDSVWLYEPRKSKA